MGMPNMLIDERKPISHQSNFGNMFDYNDQDSPKQNAGGYDTYGKFEDEDD